MCIYKYTCICLYTYVYLYAFMFIIYVYLYMYIYTYICLYVYKHVHMYIRVVGSDRPVRVAPCLRLASWQALPFRAQRSALGKCVLPMPAGASATPARRDERAQDTSAFSYPWECPSQRALTGQLFIPLSSRGQHSPHKAYISTIIHLHAFTKGESIV